MTTTVPSSRSGTTEGTKCCGKHEEKHIWREKIKIWKKNILKLAEVMPQTVGCLGALSELIVNIYVGKSLQLRAIRFILSTSFKQAGLLIPIFILSEQENLL